MDNKVLDSLARGMLWTLAGRRAMVCAVCGQPTLRRQAGPAAAGCAGCGSHLLVAADSPIGRGRRIRQSRG